MQNLKKIIGFRATSDYKVYVQSNLVLKKRFIRWLRFTLSVKLIIDIFLLFYGDGASLQEKIFYPLALIINFTITSLLQNKRFEALCSLYIFILSTLAENLGIGLTLAANEASDKKFMKGLEMGFAFSVLFVSKLPFYYVFLSSTSIMINIFYSTLQDESKVSMENVAIFSIFFIFLNILFHYQEALDFEIWSNLQKNLKATLGFQSLIHEFPSDIIIISEKSWKSDSLLYKNQGAARKISHIGNDFSVRQFLEQFTLEVENSENFNSTSNFKKFPTIVNELLKRDKAIPEKYIHTIARLKKESERENLKTEGTLISETTFLNTNDFNAHHDILTPPFGIKYEIKAGNIKWNSEDALILIFTDISSTEKIRELFNLHENKDKMLATVSHELRTPMNGIIGMLDNVDEQIERFDKNKIKYCISVARKSAKTLLLMINNLLDMSLIQKGRLELNITDSIIHKLIEEVLSLVEMQVKNKNLKLFYENSLPKDVKVLVDPNRFQQILLNLLNNACKFTSYGNIRNKIGRKNKGERLRNRVSLFF